MSLPGLLGYPERRPNPKVHIVFAYSYQTGTSLPLDYWMEDSEEDDYWLEEFISADPDYVHNDIRNWIIPADANGIYEFDGVVCSGRSTWEATIDDEVWLEGTVARVYEVVQHDV